MIQIRLELASAVDSALAEAAARAGAHLACYKGCAVCCFGPFPITEADAVVLREALGELRDREPAVAAGIEARAEAARDRLAGDFPGDARTGVLDVDLDEAAFAARFPDLACPVLDPVSGACLMHEARPIACRLYGLPSRVNGEDLPHCPLCFKRATTEETEAARAVIEIPIEPEAGLARTVVAYAFAEPFRQA